MTITSDKVNLIGLIKSSKIIITQFAPQCQKASRSLEQLLNRDLLAWAEQLDAEYAQLQQIDAALRRALDENLDPDKHDILIALSDSAHQQMTDIEAELKQGPSWLLHGGDDG